MLSESLALFQVLLASFGNHYSAFDLDLFNVTCGDPTWGGNVVVNPNGRLTATLLRDCHIVLKSSGSIATLNKNVIDSVAKEYIVKAGPVEETYYSVPSTYFEVTFTSNAEGYKTVFNNELHIVSDKTSRLMKVTRSKKIQGSGNSQYLKVMNDDQSVSLDANDSSIFQYREVEYVELEQPSFAPTPIFISESKKALMKAFNQDSRDNANALANFLLGGE